MHFSDKQAEDRPKSPAAASNVDLFPQETSRREAEKPIKGSIAVIRGILDCQSVLAVSARVLCLVVEYFILTMSSLTEAS